MFKFTHKDIVGGVHPLDDGKALTRDCAVEPLSSLPPRLYLQLKQHPGDPAIPTVEVGETVQAGQLIAKSGGRFSAPIHAPLDGDIVAIDAARIELKPAPTQQPLSTQKPAPIQQLSNEQRLDVIANSGIVGMGGAMFPLYDKLALVEKYSIKYLLINGSECEPYMTCDDRVMREQSAQIVGGIRLLMEITHAQQAIIGIEKNKPEAIAALTDASSEDPKISVHPLPALYPLGSSKQLIRALTGIQLAPRARSASYGVLVHNVASCVAVFRAFHFGHPMTHRIVTVSGRAITRPANILAPIGTPASHLIAQCGGFSEQPTQMVFGGPMMGHPMYNVHQPILKGTCGLLLLGENEVALDMPTNCLRCGRCANVCPMQLQPLHLLPLIQHEEFDTAKKLGLEQCLSCGACAYVCPASLPLTASFNWGRNELKKQRYMDQKAEFTRQAAASKQQRLAEEAAQKAAAKAEKAAKRASRSRRSATKEEEVS
ncbi:electron transport complex subunit RsxC [Celerinatantimonas sp. YJH-8]|uniref:electron transport complex subunit RsxC n=1 Tax=Celerinatantimonas sp. YJH-8 TaxID=3228714 RepID=UPI0038C9E0F4